MLGGSTAGIPHQFKEQLERTTRYVYHGRKFASFSLRLSTSMYRSIRLREFTPIRVQIEIPELMIVSSHAVVENA